MNESLSPGQAHENWTAPESPTETTEPDHTQSLPGTIGHLRPEERRPGDWRDTTGQPVSLPEAVQQDNEIMGRQESTIDGTRIRDIVKRCTQEYEGRYSRPLFEVTVFLSPEDRSEIRNLLTQLDTKLEILTQTEPHWAKFMNLLERRRRGQGTFGEETAIVSHDKVNDARPILIKDQIRGISTSESIQRLFLWKNRLEEMRQVLHELSVADPSESGKSAAYGTSTQSFGELLGRLYGLNKDLPDNRAIN